MSKRISVRGAFSGLGTFASPYRPLVTTIFGIKDWTELGLAAPPLGLPVVETTVSDSLYDQIVADGRFEILEVREGRPR